MNGRLAALRPSAWVVVILASLLNGACAETKDARPRTNDQPLVVTTSAIVADIVDVIAGDAAEVVSVIPNGFDAHTYEPRPSEVELLTQADTIFVADITLNAGLSQLALLAGDRERIVDLNAVGLDRLDLIMRERSTGWNPHTWTDPVLVIEWVAPIVERLQELAPTQHAAIKVRGDNYVAELESLNEKIQQTFNSLGANERKVVVYHDAWEYFGRRYNLDIIGALQAVDFAEPSSGEIARMAERIREEDVPAFFGSEVFPSDVLEALETASGARYIPNLADDRLNGTPGDRSYGYIPLMETNAELLVEGLRR